MGINSTRGEHGKPVANSTARTMADLQAGYDYTAAVGNRVLVNNYSELTTGFVDKFGFAPYDGLEAFNLDSGETTIYSAFANDWLDPDSLSIQTDGVFTPSSGWRMGTGTQYMIRLGFHLVAVYASFQRNGSDLSVGANGNIDNTTVGRWSLPPALRPQPLQGGYAGRLTQYMVDTTGLMQLTAAAPGNTIGNQDYLSATGLFIV